MCTCMNCSSGIYLDEGVRTFIGYVDRDMAIDCGIPEMEGEPLYQVVQIAQTCPCCEGDFENCDRCRKSTNIQDSF